MTHARHQRTSSLHRRGGAVVGIGAAAGGMLFAALAQLTAPAAHADAITNSLEDTIAAGNADYATASSDFSNLDVPDGLGWSFAGLNDYLLAPIADVSYNGYAELFEGYTGAGTYFSFPELPDPTTFAATSADVAQALANAQTDFTTAAGDFGSSDIIDGASYAFQGIGQLVDAPEIEVIGLTDTLLGSL